MEDRMTFEILADGTIRTIVDGISSANHASADSFVLGIDRLLGTHAHVHKRGDAHSHAHAHVHAHTHEKEKA
jgi:hypothetical protein